MREAVIVEAVRTPLGRGKQGGKLSGVHAVDLLAHVLKAAVERSGIDPLGIDDVIAGCVSQVGEQGINIARNGLLAAGFPVEVPGTSVDRQCGSSQQAIHFGAQGVQSGAYDLVVACGVESMSRVPMGASVQNGPGFPFSKQLAERFDYVPQGISAEMIAEKWDVPREELDQIGLRSQELAKAARDEGRFDREIVPVPVEGDTVSTDEGIRETSLEVLGQLKTSFKPEGGKVTAGNSSQITDGASAVIITTPERAEELGLKPRARFHSFALAAADPVIMLTAPIPATQKVLDRANLTMDDIDVVEINEAFASVLAAWQREMGLSPEETTVSKPDGRINPNGGAIALGHPLGASGARLCTTLLHELERRGARFGLQTMCEGGGMANAMIIERIA
ncbi:MAG: thiolase family protein [Actinomycetota bacterium]